MKNKMNILRTILIVLLLITFNIIFGFSAQDGEKSSSISRKITENITKNIQSIQKLEPIEKEKVLKKIEHIIRKLAHFSLYTLVGILLMSLMSTYNLEEKKRIKISLEIGLIYSISDEIHQFFTPDRSPLIGDVLIDSSGVIVGIVIIILFQPICALIKNDKIT